MSFVSPKPKVTLVNTFAKPYENAIATARTCYSGSGVITTEQVAEKPELRDQIAHTIYQAGHHTTLQHGHVQFALENVSRQFIWSFLHSHPFYNSEQVSQRYVRVGADQMTIPNLHGKALGIYKETLAQQTDSYLKLIDALTPEISDRYFQIFPSRQAKPEKGRKVHRLAKRWIPKHSQEVARYVLPVATFAYLYHTVSVLTLLRYHRLAAQYDVPTETKLVVQEMMAQLLAYDPQLSKVLEDDLPIEETLEFKFWQNAQPPANNAWQKEFREEFDASLEGHTSKLISYNSDNEAVLAQSVREVLGLPRAAMTDEAAIALVLDPAQNKYLGENMNVTTMAKLTRVMHHPTYTFRKKLSHTADSQDQRHRMTPASRPMLSAYLSDDPDYIEPQVVRESPKLRELYRQSMEQTWENIARLRQMGVSDEHVGYLLPNAVSIRFTESGDLSAMHHKLRMRLCYNAQEEIFWASKDEALQIQQVNPEIGQYLGAPCTIRKAAGTKPFCPEGERYCGIPVWQLPIEEYERAF